jgi:ribosome-binding factor A
MARVAERVRAELSDMLLRGEVRDPEARGAIVSAVTVTSDLSLARIYVRLLETEATAARRTALVKALERAKGHVRRELAARLALRTVPDLRFAWDDTADHAERVDALLAEVAADRDREALEREDARGDDPTTGHLPDASGGDGEP